MCHAEQSESKEGHKPDDSSHMWNIKKQREQKTNNKKPVTNPESWSTAMSF